MRKCDTYHIMSVGLLIRKEEMVKQIYSSITIWKIVRFDTCPSRTNPQESNLEGFSLHVTPRQITQTLYASVINQKQGILPMSNVLKPVHGDKIGDNSPQKRSIK